MACCGGCGPGRGGGGGEVRRWWGCRAGGIPGGAPRGRATRVHGLARSGRTGRCSPGVKPRGRRRLVAGMASGRCRPKRNGVLTGGADHRRGDPHRLGLGWASRHPHVPPHLEAQERTVGVSDVQALAVIDLDHGYATAVDERLVQRIVVDRQPSALIETQEEMSTRDQRMGDPHIGAQVSSDHHVVARCEGAF